MYIETIERDPFTDVSSRGSHGGASQQTAPPRGRPNYIQYSYNDR